MALQRVCRSELAGGLCRDAAHAGGVEGADQQDGPQRRARHRADDAGRTLSSSACGMVSPSALAVFMLMTNSNGQAAGTFAQIKMLLERAVCVCRSDSTSLHLDK
jgi:hypothetical protein